MYKDLKILVTGGTGSWGIELIRQLLTYEPKKIIIYSRNENSQVELKRVMNDKRLLFFIGDIRDKDALLAATTNVDIIFHLAALKHVPICEENPTESIKTNIIGTQNVIEAAIENEVKKVLYISTDKAADPVNTYGMTKALGEKLILHANDKSEKTKFSCVRGGNVLGSSGSVVPLFKKQIEEIGEVHLTDKRMVRYFIAPEDAIKTLLKTAQISQGGEIFVMNMRAFRIIDLAEILIEQTEKKNVKIVEIGIRKGEKLEEVLIAEVEKPYALQLDEELILITPEPNTSQLSANLENSNQMLLTKDEIKLMLLKANLL